MSIQSARVALPVLPAGGAAATYADKVLGYSPIAYWTLSEGIGTTAVDEVNSPAQDGTYSGPTLAAVTGPDGVLSAPSFDGVNDGVDIGSVASSINVASGSVSIWAKINSAAEWTTGTERLIEFATDSNNRASLYKSTAGEVLFLYNGGGAGKSCKLGPLGAGDSGWIHIVATWDTVADEINIYQAGEFKQSASGLGTWTGSVSAATIGYSGLFGTYFWGGAIAHVAIFDTALDASAIADLATV